MRIKQDRFSGFFNERLETLAGKARSAEQHAQLAKIVQHAYRNCRAVREKFDRAGVKPGEIQTTADLLKIPITPKHELANLQQKDPPFGGFLGVPLDKIRRICMSPGPIYEPDGLHAKDEGWAQAVFAAGFRKNDICQITFSYHLVPVAYWFEDAFEAVGCISVPGGVGNTEQQVRMLHDLKVTGYVGTPSFLAVLAEKAKAAGYDPARDLHLEVGFVSAEMLPESFRQKLQETFQMRICQGYGTADVGCLGFECREQNGMHMPYKGIVEIVDPETGRQLGPGEVGEIVVTVFNEAYPLIRFGTGDLSYYHDDPCACGRTAPRLMKILGRVDQMAKVKGMFIHPGNVKDLADAFPEIKAYKLVVTRENDADQMTLVVELDENIPQSDALRDKVGAAMPQFLRLKGDVQFVPRDSLGDSSGQIEDQRKWD